MTDTRKRRRNYASSSDNDEEEEVAMDTTQPDDQATNESDEGHDVPKTEVVKAVHDENMYQVLGSDTFQKLSKIDMLPKWMASGERVSNDITSSTVKIKTWEHKNRIDKELRDKLKENGIKTWYPIQAAALPLLLPQEEKSTERAADLCIAAPTGSGKTLVYSIPLVELVRPETTPSRITAIVLLPTQTLADQVATVLNEYMPEGRTCMLLTSVNSLQSEREKLWENTKKGKYVCSGAHILVCTIGRLLEHMYYVEPDTYFSLDDSPSTSVRPSSLDLTHVAMLVVDEADRLMHDTRFDWAREIELAKGEGSIRKVLLSATLSHDTQLLSQFRLHAPMLIRADADNKAECTQATSLSVALPSTLTQQFIVCEAQMKPLSLFGLLKRKPEWTTVLVFVQSRDDANRLGPLLTAMVAAEQSPATAFRVETFHAHMFSAHRTKILKRFVAGTTRVLIASDVVARGLDVEGLKAVINYNQCTHKVNYTHRAGRTARQGAEGTVVSLIGKEEVKSWTAFLRESGWTKDVAKIDVGLTPELVTVYKTALQSVKQAQNEFIAKRKGLKRKK